MLNSKYDAIYVGAGIINVLDAINAQLSGKSVLVIEESSDIGGAWKSIAPFDINFIENAVHYLMYNPQGYLFLEDILGVPLSRPGFEKYLSIKLFNKKVLGSVRNPLARLLYNLSLGKSKSKSTRLFSYLQAFASALFDSNISKSRYPFGGSASIVHKVRELALQSSLHILYRKQVASVQCFNSTVSVKIVGDIETYYCSSLVVSHGFKPPELLSFDEKVYSVSTIDELRPSLHVKVKLKHPINKRSGFFRYSQVIFAPDSILKYCHNLNKFLTIPEIDVFYLVVALRHNCVKSDALLAEVVDILDSYGILPPTCSRTAISFFWQDIHLPLLANDELTNLEILSHNMIKSLRTEELCSGLAECSKEWLELRNWLLSLKPFN